MLSQKTIAMQTRILVIDNDQDILDAVQIALEAQNYSVRSSAYVDDIFQLVEESQPDLIIIDYLLYGINGGELCHMIKSDQRTAHIPVIIFSGYPRVIQSLGTYESDAFISKPFELSHFMETIESCLARSAGER